MPIFHYKAVNSENVPQEGQREAVDEFSLGHDLKIEGLTLISAFEEKINTWQFRLKSSLFSPKVSTHEKIVLNRNLAAMLGAGLSLNRALTILEKQNRNKGMKKVLSHLNDNVKKGSPLSSALAEFPKIFSPLLVSMVQAGEESGKLVETLNIVSEQMEKTYALQQKIKGAMIYPGVIISAMLIIAVFMLIYIVPTLTKTFSELNVELPGPTKLIIWLSDTFQQNAIVGLLSVILLFVGLISLAKTKMGKRFFDWLWLHIPVVSEIVKEVNAARTSRTLASLLSSGVAFVQSVKIVGDVVQNSFYKELLLKAQKSVELGQPISQTFIEAENLYPTFVGEMISVGEETGELGQMLLKVATFYEEEVDQKTKNLSTIIEPFLMLVVGFAVGFFAISMISPMYSLVENI